MDNMIKIINSSILYMKVKRLDPESFSTEGKKKCSFPVILYLCKMRDVH